MLTKKRKKVKPTNQPNNKNINQTQVWSIILALKTEDKFLRWRSHDKFWPKLGCKN